MLFVMSFVTNLYLLHGNFCGQGIKHFGLVLWKEVIKNWVVCTYKPNQYCILNTLGFKHFFLENIEEKTLKLRLANTHTGISISGLLNGHG